MPKLSWPILVRAAEIQNALSTDKIAHTQRVTAIIEVVDEAGETHYLVSNSSGSLTAAQEAMLGPREIAITGGGHAEAQGFGYAAENGMKVTRYGASKAVCVGCASRTPPARFRTHQ
jgi:hypothetical protein